jgi:hypothetical protein
MPFPGECGILAFDECLAQLTDNRDSLDSALCCWRRITGEGIRKVWLGAGTGTPFPC